MTSAGVKRLVGVALTAFYLVLVAWKAQADELQSLLWLCHASLLLASVALLIGRDSLTTAVLICMMTPTLVWWLDAASLLLADRLLVGAIDPPSSALGWAATSHHLFLAPLLLWLNARAAPTSAEIFLAGFIVVLLIAAACVGSSPQLNINWNRGVLPGVDHPLVHGWNGMSPILRVPLTMLGGLVLVVAPGAVALRAIACGPAPGPTPDCPATTR